MNKDQKKIILEIKDFIKDQCKNVFDKKYNKENKKNDSVYDHIDSVLDFSKKLANHYKANTFVVICASYLHDIYYIQTGIHKDHEIKGCDFAKRYLDKFNIDPSNKKLILKCIKHHRGSIKYKRDSIEEKIVACSDALDHIKRSKKMFYRLSKEKNYNQVINFIKHKLKKAWNKLELDYAKQMISKEYNIAIKYFEE